MRERALCVYIKRLADGESAVASPPPPTPGRAQRGSPDAAQLVCPDVVVVVNVALHYTPRIIERQRRSSPSRPAEHKRRGSPSLAKRSADIAPAEQHFRSSNIQSISVNVSPGVMKTDVQSW